MTTTPAPVEWRLVPVEPTVPMLNAGWAAARLQGFDSEELELDPIYSALLAASPAPDLEGLRERVEQIVGDAILEAAQLGLGAGDTIPERVEAAMKAACLRDPAVKAIISLFTPEGEGRE